MSSLLAPNAQQQFLDQNGAPMAGGFVYTYVPGTTTPTDTWSDVNLTVLNANPILLDQAGRCQLWIPLGTLIRQIVTDGNGAAIWDQITGFQLTTFATGNLTVNGNLVVTGNSNVSGNSVVGGNQSVVGTISTNGLNVAGPVTTGALSASGNVVASGGLAASSLSISGNSDLNTLAVTGAASFVNIDVSATATIDQINATAVNAGAIVVTGNANVDGGLMVVGPAGFNGASGSVRVTITGSRSGTTAAVLEQVLQALQAYGQVLDSTSP